MEKMIQFELFMEDEIDKQQDKIIVTRKIGFQHISIFVFSVALIFILACWV